MMATIFRKTIFVSLLSHIAIFSIFSFSLGNRVPQAHYTSASYFGQFLRNYQVKPLPATASNIKYTRRPFRDESGLFMGPWPPAKQVRYLVLSDWREKPQLHLAFNTQKLVFTEKLQPLLFSLKRNEPAIIFHPLLPYSFVLYFKDRQIAHVELMFRINSSGPRNSIAVKRKISSGNLEVDLLTTRYIGHYLFIQKASFAPNDWQVVKVDLSAKND